MDLKEALSTVREMAKFFEGFRKIEEVIEAGSLIEGEIKALETARDQVASELAAVTRKKAEEEKISDEVRERIKVLKGELAAEAKIGRELADKEKKEIAKEIDELKNKRDELLDDHSVAISKISRETEEAKKALAAVKKELETIKSKL